MKRRVLVFHAAFLRYDQLEVLVRCYRTHLGDDLVGTLCAVLDTVCTGTILLKYAIACILEINAAANKLGRGSRTLDYPQLSVS